MEISVKDQFKGFLETPQIFAENGIFEYPLIDTRENIAKALEFEPSAPPEKSSGKEWSISSRSI